MSEQWTLHAGVNESNVYITDDIKNPELNTFVLTLTKLSIFGADELEAVDHNKTEGEPKIILYCNWNSKQDTLCTEKEAAAIKISPTNGCKWSVSWEPKGVWKKGGCFKLVPGGVDVEDGFVAAFEFKDMITTSLSGEAQMYIRLENMPGFSFGETFIATINKRNRIKIKFYADPETVEYGETSYVSWDVVNAKTCRINSIDVDLHGTWEVKKIKEDMTYKLEADGGAAAKEVTVKVTNWKHMGDVDCSLLPDEPAYSRSDGKLCECGGEKYIFLNGTIYQLDGERKWIKVSETDLEQAKNQKNYSTICRGDKIFILGNCNEQNQEEDSYGCCYNISDKKWSKENLMVRVNEGCAAFFFQGNEYFLNIFDKKSIQIMKREEEDWNVECVFNIDSYIYNFDDIEAVDVARCVADAYMAIMDRETKNVYIFKSSNMYDFKESIKIEDKVKGWFKLIEINERLLFLYDKGIFDVFDQRRQIPCFLPMLSEKSEERPWVGQGGQELFLVAPADKIKKTAVLWRFRDA